MLITLFSTHNNYIHGHKYGALPLISCGMVLCRYRLYIGSIAARLQSLRTTTPDYARLANHMPQYYIVSYFIRMLMSTRGSPKSLTLLQMEINNFKFMNISADPLILHQITLFEYLYCSDWTL